MSQAFKQCRATSLKHQGRQQFLPRDITFMWNWRLRYIITGKQVDAAIDELLV